MELYTLQEDVPLLYVTARSFPDGIDEAFKELEARLPDGDRTFYGISKPEPGKGIVYKAGAIEKNRDEPKTTGLGSFVIPKGRYLTETLHHFREHLPRITEAFDKLLTHPQLDPASYCMEWYKSEEEVVCMVKLRA